MPSPRLTTITLQLKPFLCRPGCGNELGVTDGLRLYTCSSIILTKVQLQCPDCGAVRVWRPVGIGLSQLQDAREQLEDNNHS